MKLTLGKLTQAYRRQCLITAACGSFLSPGALHAQIKIDATAFWRNQANADLGTTFDASGSDKLVYIVTGEHGFNQTANGVIGKVFYDGVELTRAVARNAIKPNVEAGILVDDTWNAIFYLDNPGEVHVGGVITTSGFQSRGSMAVIALTGTAEGTGNTVAGARDSNTASLTTAAGSIVIGSYGLGGSGNTSQLASVTTPEWDVEVARQVNGNQWDGHVVAYQNGVAAGTASYTFNETRVPDADGRTGRHVILAEFLVAPPAASFQLVITPNQTAGLFDFSWDSQPDKVYDLVSSTDLASPVAEWPVHDPDGEGPLPPYADIPATGTATTLTAVPGDGPKRFFAMVEKAAPPIFKADFEGDENGFTVIGSPNDWAWGTPNSDNNAGLTLTTGNGGSTKCWGTHLGTGGKPSGLINTAANSILRSPNINLTGVTGAQLSFAAAYDAQNGDVIEVLVKEVGTGNQLGPAILPVTETLPKSSNWTTLGPFDLPAAADNANIYLE